MFFFLSKILDVFLSPYAWGLVLLGAAVPWRARSDRRWKRRRILGAFGLVILLLASSQPVSNAIEWRLEHASAATFRADVTYDAVVLLGGVVDEEITARTGQPAYNENVERLVMAHKLLREDKARVVIISGAAVDPSLASFGEAVVLGRQLEEWGIARSRIIIEDRARNTRENAVYTREITRARGIERVVIVTSAFHMLRAAECFAAVDMKVDTLPVDFRAHPHARWTDVIPRTHALATTTSMVREATGRLVYRVQGYAKAVD